MDGTTASLQRRLVADENRDELNFFTKEYSFPIYFTQPYSNPFTDRLSVLDTRKSNVMDDVLITRNSFGYRSDEFLDKHDGTHILFAGCSQTFGTGLNLEEMWSYKLYNKIANDRKLSGYFNLSWPGASLRSIILSIIQYINQFGKPDILFINIPDIARHYAYDPKENKIRSAMVSNGKLSVNKDSEIFKEWEMNFFADFLMLEKICDASNIMLFTTSWVSHKNILSPLNFIKNHYQFKSFCNYSERDLVTHCAEYMSLFPEDDNAILARDGGHEGTAVNDFWTNMLYREYEKRCAQ